VSARAITALIILAACAGGEATTPPGRARRARARLQVRALREAGHRKTEAADYAEAEVDLRRALALSESALGPHDLETARTLNDLGMFAKYTARFDEGAADYARALTIAAGPAGDVLLVADLYHNLGGLEHARGRFAAGEPLARHGLAIRVRELGPEHPDVAADRAALAALLDGQGRLEEAETLYQDAIRVLERVRGPPPIELAVSLNNLAAIRTAQGRLAEAEALYRRALALKETRLGPDHPDVATTLNNLALLCKKDRRLPEAAALYARALDIFTRALGPDHPKTRTCRVNNARLLAAMEPSSKLQEKR